MPTFLCSSPHHEGSPVLHNPDNQFTFRIEYRRLDSGERPGSIALGDICRTCLEKEYAQVRATDRRSLYDAIRQALPDVPAQEGLFA
jgi:hypothetical protein